MSLIELTYPTAIAVRNADGKFHPGIRQGMIVSYFDKIDLHDEQAAVTVAKTMIEDAQRALDAVTDKWAVKTL